MYTNKQIWNVSYPIFLSLLAQNVINVTDTAFLGRVGEVELGASAMGGLYYICAFTIAFGFSTGSQIIMARRNGERNYKEVGPVMIQGVFFLFMLAAVMFTFSRLFAGDIMRVLISSDTILKGTEEFLDWRVFGFFFSFVNVMFRALFIGITRTKVLTLNAIVMALTNVLLDYLLIFGNWGFPELGIKGAAIASVMAEAVSIVFYMVYTRMTVDIKKYALNQLPSFQPETLKRILNVSFWTMIQNFFSLSTWFMFFLFVEHLGERALAITNIIRNVSGIPFMVAMAFATTCGSLVSNLIGAGEIKSVPGTIRQHVRIGYVFVLPLVLFFALFPDLVLSIYTDIPDLKEASIPSLWVLCSAYLILVPANVYFQAVSGTGNTRTALGLELCVLAVYLAYITYVILYLRVDVAFCWTTEHLYGICILTLSYIYIKKGNWQKKQI